MNSYFSGMPLKLKEKNISNKRAGAKKDGCFRRLTNLISF